MYCGLHLQGAWSLTLGSPPRMPPPPLASTLDPPATATQPPPAPRSASAACSPGGAASLRAAALVTCSATSGVTTEASVAAALRIHYPLQVQRRTTEKASGSWSVAWRCRAALPRHPGTRGAPKQAAQDRGAATGLWLVPERLRQSRPPLQHLVVSQPACTVCARLLPRRGGARRGQRTDAAEALAGL